MGMHGGMGKGQGNGNGMGNGMANGMAGEATQRAAMLTQAVEQGVITQDEAQMFEMVHTAIDAVMLDNISVNGQLTGNAADAIADLLASGAITQAQEDAFNEIHSRLEAAGLMR